VTVTRDAKGQAKLAGTLGVDRADITAKPPVPNGVVAMEVVEINKPRAEDEDPPAPRLRGPPVNLDVAITARRGVFVKGSGLNVEMSLDSHVGGTITAPLLTGTARVVVGDYDFAGKRFDFDERSIIRLGSTAETIRLDLIATRDDPGVTNVTRGNSVTTNNIVRSGGLTAVVRVQGTAAKPVVTLSSVPVLPQDEVLAQVLFGHSASQLSSFEAAQLASALTSLATGGGFDVIGGLRQFARLDRLAFGGGESGMAVSGGKYLTDDIYVELTGGGREDPSAQVEWRVKRNLSVVSSVSERGNTRLSVRFRRAY
jgi:translocation and assembly module TamB